MELGLKNKALNFGEVDSSEAAGMPSMEMNTSKGLAEGTEDRGRQHVATRMEMEVRWGVGTGFLSGE